GRADEGEALLAGPFFAREEWGTNVRQVFVEIRLQKALSLARAGQAAEALGLLQGLEREVPGFSFTKDGLDAFVHSPRAQYAAGEVAALARDQALARAHWTEAAKGQESFFRGLPYAYLASRRLGGVDEASWRKRMEAALADSAVF